MIETRPMASRHALALFVILTPFVAAALLIGGLVGTALFAIAAGVLLAAALEPGR
jgi:hypothetical protein